MSNDGFRMPAPAPHIGFRRDNTNPRLASCPLHLRRVCGTCASFEGELRGGPAPCSKFALLMRPDRGADHCDRWERKWVRP